jgi:hypothetical protein
MNKIIFCLASVIAAVTFATEASALPLFARQTGMECAACHFQHFPLLNGFGRAFKSTAYSMMGVGVQTRVEGDRLSIPSTLNMAALTTFGYEKTNAASAGILVPSGIPGTNNDGNGTLFTPGHNGELSLFFGGRINDNAGFLTEIGLIGLADQSSAKLPILFEVADGTRAGIVPFTTNGQGASYGFEVLNTGANAVHQMSGVGGFNGAHSNALSAQQYIGTATAATGIAFVVNNSGYFVNVTKYNQMGSGDLTGGANTTGSGSVMGAGTDSTYLRVAGIFDVAGWDTGVGIQSWSGSSLCMSDTTGTGSCNDVPAVVTKTEATAIDGQMQGEWNKMPVGLYASYATAPASDSVTPNTYNPGTLTRSSFNISGELGVLPGIATLGAAIRLAKSGVDEGIIAAGSTTGANATDNAIMLTVTYKLSQNMMATLSHTANSGSYWTAGGNANTLATGSRTTTINVFTLF